MSAAAIARAVARRELRAEQVVRDHLDRLTRVEPQVEAFLHVGAGAALEQAAALDAALDAGRPAPPLAGVPVAIKDVLALQGVPTTCGSRLLEGWRPPYTATAVQRLQDAGAIVIGKTNMDEFAMGSSTENSAYKATRNPWDLSRVPGGSSGGSAAAVAAGQACVALGSDTGGSVRQPAAFCGVVGLKPSYGRVSRYGLVAYASSFDQVGPIGRSVEDVALVLQAIAGHDPRDATSAGRPVPDYTRSLGRDATGLTIGVPWAFLEHGVQQGTLRAFRESLAALQGAGARLVDVELPSLPHAISAYYLIATAEASSNLARFDGVRYGRRVAASDLRGMYGQTRDHGFGAEVKRRILLGTFALSSGYYDAYYVRAQKVRFAIRGDLERALQACDAVATPTSPFPAFRLGERTADPLQMYLADVFTVPANLAGLPGLSLPCGFDEGLPVGLQLLGRAFEEETLLRLGSAYQAVTAHHRALPEL
jgi:aspartyl-tRNA(Asn)/glutamyl-tRNA(Gln) amidotransferase subunit A